MATKSEDSDDLVMTAFKKQQKQYQDLMKGLQVRICLYLLPVMSKLFDVANVASCLFSTRNNSFDFLVLQNIEVPLAGDAAAIKKSASAVEALKKKVGVPDYQDVLNAEMKYAMACAGQDVKKFVSSILSELDVSKTAYERIGQEIMDAIQEAETASGKELNASNDKGWKILMTKIAEIEKAYNLQDASKVKQEAVLDMYAKHVAGLKEAVDSEITRVKDAESISANISLSGLKPQVV